MLVPTLIAGLVAIVAPFEPSLSGCTSGIEPLGSENGQSTPPNFKVAFIGDQGDGNAALAVLRLIRDEVADMVLHQGDFDYEENPTGWDDRITSVLGADFPYFRGEPRRGRVLRVGRLSRQAVAAARPRDGGDLHR